jgi:hypothetical protein
MIPAATGVADLAEFSPITKQDAPRSPKVLASKHPAKPWPMIMKLQRRFTILPGRYRKSLWSQGD